MLSLAAVVLALVAAGGPRMLPPRVPLAPVALSIIVVCPLLILLAVAPAAAAPPILVSVPSTVILTVVLAVLSSIVAVFCTVATSISVASSAAATASIVVVIGPAPVLALCAATPAAGAARRIGLEVVVVGAAIELAGLRLGAGSTYAMASFVSATTSAASSLNVLPARIPKAMAHDAFNHSRFTWSSLVGLPRRRTSRRMC